MFNPETRAKERPARLEIAPPVPKVCDETIGRLSEIFQLLGDPSRLKILLTLARDGEQNVSALCDRLAQTQPAVSHHLKRLRRGGLLSYRRQGKNNFYALAPGYLKGILEPLFAHSGSARQIQVGEVVLTLRGN